MSHHRWTNSGGNLQSLGEIDRLINSDYTRWMTPFDRKVQAERDRILDEFYSGGGEEMNYKILLFKSQDGKIFCSRQGFNAQTYCIKKEDISSNVSIPKDELIPICDFVNFEGELYKVSDINSLGIILVHPFNFDIIKTIHYKQVGKLKFYKENNMLHASYEKLKETEKLTVVKKEKKIRTSISLVATVILTMLYTFGFLGYISTGFMYLALFVFAGFVVCTHICECTYKLNLKIEVSCGILNFILFNMLTIVLGVIAAAVNSFTVFVPWNHFLLLFVAAPTAISLVVSVIPSLYMVLKHSLVVTISKISGYIDMLFSKV